jgi:hypothetical protein
VDGFRNIIQGYRDMVKEVDPAETFDQLRDAGERYGRRMGPSMLRIVTALVTWGVGAATGMARPVTSLPGGAQAVTNAQAQGFQLMAVSGGSVSVNASGAVTLTVAAEAAVDSGAGGQQPAAQERPSSESPSSDIAKVQGQLWRYPKVIDPRTGRSEVDPIRRTILRAPIFMRAVDG